MSRYVSEFTIIKPKEEIYGLLLNHMTNNGYKLVNYEFENVFHKGNNILTVPCFFKFIFTDNSVRIEAWNKSGVGISFYGENKPNKIMQKQIVLVEALLAENGCTCVTQGSIQEVTGAKEYPNLQSTVSKGEFIKKYMPISLKKEFNYNAIVFYVLSAILIFAAFAAESLLWAIVFCLTAVLTAVMHLTKNTVVTTVLATIGSLAALIYFIAGVFGYFSILMNYSYYIDIGADYDALVRVGALTMVVATVLSTVIILTTISMFVSVGKVNKYYKLITRR